MSPDPPDIVRGDLTSLLSHARALAAPLELQAGKSVLLSSANHEWYTPDDLLQIARDVMGGGFDLDPASCPEANTLVQADRVFTVDDDGLTQGWPAERVWLNPPFGVREPDRVSLQWIWTTKAREEYEAGRARQIMGVVTNATETEWFQTLLDVADTCLVRGRIGFWGPAAAGNGNVKGSALFYFGKHTDRFLALTDPRGRAIPARNPARVE